MGTKTYLQYTNALLRRFNEPELTSGDFASATGFHAFAKDAINLAISDIGWHVDCKWPFLKQDGSVTLVAGDETEDKPAAAIDIDWDSFYINYDAGLTNKYAEKLYQISYQRYEQEHLVDRVNAVSSTERTKPQFVVRNRDNNFIFGPLTPDEAYTVKYKYYAAPTELSAYDDTSEIPDAFADVVNERALFYLFTFREEIENASICERKSEDKLRKMVEILIPRISTMRYS